ncbi:MAG TPA: hypothetical protein V6D22_22720 [Candidatus Obscuribacterales bacterium]
MTDPPSVPCRFPLDDPQHPLVDGAPKQCHRCRQALCLRQQVINLALGDTDEMLCLSCLATENNQSQDALLTRVKHYIQKRDCFAKQWSRYPSQQYCPYPQNCVPGACFSD